MIEIWMYLFIAFICYASLVWAYVDSMADIYKISACLLASALWPLVMITSIFFAPLFAIVYAVILLKTKTMKANKRAGR